MREGRGVLVTGAANGIGRATAARLAEAGARVCAVDREEADAPPGGFAIVADLAELDALPAVVEKAEREVGPLDALVNVAGIYEPAAFEDVTAQSLARTLAVNLEAPILLAARAARGMAERGYGRIVNVTSVHARHSARHALAYDASKAGLEGATRTLGIELASSGVLVNAVAPGFVATRMSAGDDVDHARLPIARSATAEEVADCVLWLAGPGNTYVAAQTVTIDGGLTSTF
jgi:NAD(P)-dependent dehydrogenase (short-subunit alcohol dehydrogenase family)